MRLATKPLRFMLRPNTEASGTSNLMVLIAMLAVGLMCVSSAQANPSVSSNALTSPLGPALPTQDIDEPGIAEAVAGVSRTGTLVRVPLPIDSKVSSRVRKTLQELAERAPLVAPASGKPVVVLEFGTSGQTGRGSELEACIALARFLGDSDLHRIHTVAYIPSKNENETTQLNGHAVLVAVAANQLALEPWRNNV